MIMLSMTESCLCFVYDIVFMSDVVLHMLDVFFIHALCCLDAYDCYKLYDAWCYFGYFCFMHFIVFMSDFFWILTDYCSKA